MVRDGARAAQQIGDRDGLPLAPPRPAVAAGVRAELVRDAEALEPVVEMSILEDRGIIGDHRNFDTTPSSYIAVTRRSYSSGNSSMKSWSISRLTLRSRRAFCA